MLESDEFKDELLDIFGTEMPKERGKIDKILAKNPLLKNAEILK
jgi:hypothetical protein